MRARLAGDEHAAARVPARMQIGVGVLEEGELGAGRKAGVERVEPDLAVAGRAFVIARRNRPGPVASTPSERMSVAAQHMGRPRRRGHRCCGSAAASRTGPSWPIARAATPPMRLQRLGVGAADAVLAAPHGIDEVAVLAPHRIALGAAHRPAAADIHHDVVVGQLDRQAVGEEMQPDAVVSSRAGRSRRNWRSRPIAKRRLAVLTVGTSRPGKSARSRVAGQAVDLATRRRDSAPGR